LLTNLFSSAFLIYGSFCFSMFFFVWFLIPETKGLSLEKMDDLFGVTELVKRIEDEDREAHARSTAEPEIGMDGKEVSAVQREVVEDRKVG
jgi:hypothetical protein